MLLRLESVSKIYGGRLIFKAVSLTLEHGQTLLLAGPNGAGKSTLLKIISGLTAPSAGKVEHAFKLGGACSIGYMGHQTFIYPQLSAFENLRFWSRFHGLNHTASQIEKALERVELERFLHERAGTFSRGMAQRLNLARILMQSPELLLLDEPATGLDARSKSMLTDEIVAAAERGAGIVWISHSLAEDLPRADLVAVLPAAPAGKAQKTGGGLSFFGSVTEFERHNNQARPGSGFSAGQPEGASGGRVNSPDGVRI